MVPCEGAAAASPAVAIRRPAATAVFGRSGASDQAGPMRCAQLRAAAGPNLWKGCVSVLACTVSGSTNSPQVVAVVGTVCARRPRRTRKLSRGPYGMVYTGCGFKAYTLHSMTALCLRYILSASGFKLFSNTAHRKPRRATTRLAPGSSSPPPAPRAPAFFFVFIFPPV